MPGARQDPGFAALVLKCTETLRWAWPRMPDAGVPPTLLRGTPEGKVAAAGVSLRSWSFTKQKNRSVSVGNQYIPRRGAAVLRGRCPPGRTRLPLSGQP